jgi:tryptophan-rich sensory protein
LANSAPTSPVAASRARSALVLIGLLLLVFAVAALGGLATSQGVRDWYPALAKPAWTPPSWLFGPAWTLLYTFMALVAWRVWRRPASPERSALLRRWWVQLALNGAWSWAFFHFRSPAAGLAVIGALLLVIGSMQPRLARLDRPSALLWTPYVLWVAFATALNLSIWNRN